MTDEEKRERRRESNRRYFATHPEKKREADQRYRSAHVEEKRARQRLWQPGYYQRTYPERRDEINARRRERYHTDPDFHQREVERHKQRWTQNQADSQKRAQNLAHKRDRYHSDPEYRHRLLMAARQRNETKYGAARQQRRERNERALALHKAGFSYQQIADFAGASSRFVARKWCLSAEAHKAK